MKIGFITDLHFRAAVPGTSPIAKRECRRMPEILDQCLAALVAAGADLLVCAGDCVDTAEHPGVAEDLEALQQHFAGSGLPTIVVPGNHDPAPDAFYQVFPRPPRRVRMGDCEFITFFDDVCAPGSVQAQRSDNVLQTMRDLLAEPDPHVALTFLVQHYVVYPPYAGTGYPHTYLNDGEIRAIQERSPRPLVVLSGHCHTGHPWTDYRGVTYFTGRALCERPYPYYLLQTEGASVRVEERFVVAG